jgi:hypothetical protein
MDIRNLSLERRTILELFFMMTEIDLHLVQKAGKVYIDWFGDRKYKGSSTVVMRIEHLVLQLGQRDGLQFMLKRISR